MIKLIIIGVISYFLYRFFIRFVLPLVKLLRMTHSSLNEVKQRMRQQSSRPQEPAEKVPPRQVEGEYIDYEEVK
ncbi:MAG TPA: hypothetical protein VFL76_02495 [Edaphocola sp.]|nr:hypothetical protein [Edaphocola sp.]